MRKKRTNFKRAISFMVDELIENSKSEKRGFPVAASFVEKGSNVLNTNVNSWSETTDYQKHAEYKCYLEFIENQRDINEIVVIITLPPCSDCLDSIFKQNSDKEWRIYYLLDDFRRKIEKTYLKTFILENEYFYKLNPSQFVTNTSLNFEVYYIIMKCIEGFLTQQPIGIKISDIEMIAKSWLKIIQKVIKRSDPAKESIKKIEVWNMIEKSKNFSENNVKHIQNSKRKKFVWITN